MRIGRTLPPAAAPLSMKSVFNGLCGWYGGASEIRRFQAELKAYHSTEHVFLVSSGKAALYLILKSLQLLQPDKADVVVPAFTCYSVPSAIIQAGFRVRLCDIDPVTLDFDYASLEEIIKSDESGKILAIIPTHLFGIPSDVSRVRGLVTGTGIKVVEDAAQSMGGKVKGQCHGTLGDVGFLSLGRGKALSTLEGGVVLTSNSDTAMVLEEVFSRFHDYSVPEIIGFTLQAIMLSIFMDPRLFWFPKALPFLKLGETHFETRFPLKKISGFQAGLSRGWQRTLKKVSSIRELNSARWTEALRGREGFNQPKVVDGDISFIRYPLLVKNLDQRREMLKESDVKGLGVMPAYPDSLDRLAELAHVVHGVCCPKAHTVAQQMVTLPVHGYLNRTDCLKISVLIEMAEKLNVQKPSHRRQGELP